MTPEELLDWMNRNDFGICQWKNGQDRDRTIYIEEVEAEKALEILRKLNGN